MGLWQSVSLSEFRTAVHKFLAINPTCEAAIACLSLCRRLFDENQYRDMDLFLASDTRFDRSRLIEAIGASADFQVDQALLVRMAQRMLSQQVSETV